MPAHLKFKLRLGEADVEKLRLVEDQPLERRRLGGGLADGGADVHRVVAFGVRRHHAEVDRVGGGPVDRLAVEAPLVRERPRAVRLDAQYDVGVDTDDRLNRRRRGGHGDVGTADALGQVRRGDRRQDGVEHGGLAARVAGGITNHHLVTAHVFRLKIVDRVGCRRGPGDVLFPEPPLVSERRGTLDLHVQRDGRAKLHHCLTGRLLRNHRRVIRLERHKAPPRAPPVALLIRDVFLLGIARLGVHLDGPHVCVVVGIDLRGAVVSPAVAAVSAQLHVRGDAALEQRRLTYFAKWIGLLPVGIISAGVSVLGETGVADQHITLFIHR